MISFLNLLRIINGQRNHREPNYWQRNVRSEIMGHPTQKETPAKPAKLPDQTRQPAVSNLETQTTPSSKGVFMMRAKGQSFEDFKKAVIQQFRDAGMIKD